VETQEQLTRVPRANAVACEGCPLFVAQASESEAAFAGLPWGHGESVSGPGSSLDATAVIREQLPAMLRSLGCRSLLDLPCGDFHWMSRVDLQGIAYIGADVVRDLVKGNAERFTKFPDRHFIHLDIVTSDLPGCDAVLCRDCLVHLPYSMIRQALDNIVKSEAKWVIMTHFPGRVNHDIQLGHWRPLDLTAKPFWLPEPSAVINEGCTEGGGAYSDKSLGLWSVEGIRAAVERMNAGPKLTIGLPYYRDWPGLWATVESLYIHHADAMRDVELIVVDNDTEGEPGRASESNHSWKARSLCEQVGARYEHFTAVSGTAAAKGRIFDLATGPAVLVMDCHVLLPPGAVGQLVEWFADNPESRDLVQGPLTAAGGQVLSTHMRPTWGSLMFGQWSTDHAQLQAGEPFEIAAQGCGLFAMRKAAWPGFHPLLRGFGPEEYHLHNRVRRAGGRCLCLPWLRWSHRFGNPDGASPPGMTPEDRLRGHLITAMDTGARMPDVPSIKRHFVTEAKAVDRSTFKRILRETRLAMGGADSLPPVLTRGWNFARALARWTAAGRPVCTEAQREERVRICQSCPHLVGESACGLCGCPIGGREKLLSKVAMATEACYDTPARWGPVKPVPAEQA